MSRQDLLQLLRPAHKVPRTIWSSRHPLNFRPNFSTLLALVVGLWIFGTGEAVLIAAGIGVSPWTVLAQGITEQTSFTVGEATFIVSVCVLLLWIPLRETPGIGTILNAILIALSIDVMAPFIPEQESLPNAIIQSAFGVMNWQRIISHSKFRSRTTRRMDDWSSKEDKLANRQSKSGNRNYSIEYRNIIRRNFWIRNNHVRTRYRSSSSHFLGHYALLFH